MTNRSSALFRRICSPLHDMRYGVDLEGDWMQVWRIARAYARLMVEHLKTLVNRLPLNFGGNNLESVGHCR